MLMWVARFFAGLLVAAVILLALALGGLRLAIVNIEHFKSEIEYLLERDLMPGLVFTGLAGDMDRFNPILSIDNVSINLPDRSQPLFIDQLAMSFDFFASLKQRRLVIREVAGQLEKLELIKDESGNWWISDLALAIESDGGPAPGIRQVLSWVPQYLKLNLNRLLIVDRQTGLRHQLTGVSASISHQQDQILVKFGAWLPEQLGRSVLIKSVINPEKSLIYVNSSNLQLTPIASLLDLDTWGLQQGVLDGEVWINMAGYQVLAVNGNLVLRDGVVQMAADKAPLQTSFHSRFSAISRPDHWRISSGFDRLEVDNKNVAGFRSQIEVGKQRSTRVVSAWVDRMPLESLPVVAGQWLPAEINQQIEGGRLDGELRDVLLRIELDRPQLFMLGARARGVSSRAFAQYPGVTNIDAELLVGNNRVSARLSGRNVSLDFGDHFNAPLELDRIEVDALAQRGDRGLSLALNRIELENSDASASGRGWLEFDQDQRPFTFIRASFENARAGNVSKYIPRKLMPQRTQEWLDRGIKGGFVPAGELQFHGRLRDIRELEREQAVEFFVDFRVEDGEVLFSPDWLPGKDGSGRVLFHNVSMRADMDRVSYDRIENGRARIVIEDFRQPVLNLHIEAEAPARDAVQSWVATPVGQPFYEVVKNFRGYGGSVNTTIEVELPLTGDEFRPTTEVQVNFNDARAYSDAWGLQITDLNGRLEASGEVLRARQIDARFFGDPIKVDIAGNPVNGHTRVTAEGVIESANLVRKLPEILTRDISGKSDWRIEMDFSPGSRPADVPVVRMHAASRLRNTAVGLPRPLDKAAAAELPMAADVDFFERQIHFRTWAGDLVRSRGRLEAVADDDYRLQQLDLAFGTSLDAATRPGLHIYGFVDEASIMEWMPVIEATRDEERILRSARLEIARLYAPDREIENLQIDLQRRDDRFIGSLNAPVVSGSFEVPLKPSTADPAVIDLEYLRIDKSQSEDEEPILKPGDLIDFRLSSKVLVFHDMLFQDLLVHARAGENRLYLDNLRLLRDRLVLRGQGQWDYDPRSNTHLSSVTMTIRGPGLGEAIDGVGFGDTMSDGTLEFQGGFTWPAPMSSLDIERLAGDARMKIEDGVLNNVEPGSGRYVGLLSLSALPRRLALDFSDVLIKGMEFAEITGTYHIEDGVLYTSDTRMDGPAASIAISGKTGISARNYDQTIKVTPKIGETLPLLGAVAQGSAVGWSLLVLQRLFKKVIDNAVEVEYQVTGSWDDPKIELIRAVDENQQELPTIDR